MTIADEASIDVRTLPPTERHPKIFGMMDALAPGGGFMIVNNHDPLPLHYHIQTKYPGQFSWQYLEQGPEVWRVMIRRLEDSGCDCCCGSGH